MKVSLRDHRLRVLVIAILLVVSSGLPPLLMGALAVQITADLGLSEVDLGTALACFFFAAGGGSALGGRWADHVGWPRASRVAGVTGAVVCFGVAFAALSFAGLIAVLVLGGLGQALAGPTSTLSVSRELPLHRQGVAIGVLRSAIPIAGMLAGLSLPFIGLTVGWRWAFVGAAAFPLLAFLLTPRRPQRRASTPSTDTDSAPRIVSSAVVTLVAGVTLATIANLGFSTFLVVWGVRVGLAEAHMGFLVGAAAALCLVVRIAGGWVADRMDTSGFRPTAVLMALGALGMAGLATARPALVVPGALLGYGAGWGWSGLFHYGMVSAHRHRAGSITGIVLTGMASGAALGPLLFGLVAEYVGYPAAWAGAAALLVAGAGLVWRGGRLLGSPAPLGPPPFVT